MEIMGKANMKEVFVAGMGKPTLHITLNDPVTIKDGLSFEKDMPREDVPVVGSPMVLDEEQRMMKRRREVEDEEDEPLIFKHIK